MANKKNLPDYEKLGAFYLGRTFDGEHQTVTNQPLLYDSKDLTTHAVCVGMTGSGKTGLCLSLLEEAAIDGIPALAIDPKGDLGNLMLTFPDLRGSDFEPWVDPAEAARKEQTPAEYASNIAGRWKKGLEEWDQAPTRIAKLKSSADVAIFTPGSHAGLPLSVLKRFDAPPEAVRNDTDAFRNRISTAASGLLTLLGIDADPVKSPEHILLSNIFQSAWSAGRNLELAELIREIQKPPFQKIGVMDLESFFPSKDRVTFSMKLNNLLASPGFAAWMEGEALDVKKLLWTSEGKPRISILSIAHLSEVERMFFVTLILNEVVTWMRSQAGTSSLRALLYMDEVFGFFPPTANPPSKKPMLTLLKQARAYGLGVVLATQNPVDLDYKGLSNAGTWFLGRLQTERDKQRILDGLEGATASAKGKFNRRKIEATLSGLKSRVFLMNNVHDDEPVLFHTRWVLSYLRGPLTRQQIQTLMSDRKKTATPAKVPDTRISGARAAGKPLLPSQITELFWPSNRDLSSAGEILYRPRLLGKARLHYVRAKEDVDLWKTLAVVASLDDEAANDPWQGSEILPQEEFTLLKEGVANSRYGEVPPQAIGPKFTGSWNKKLAAHLYRNQTIQLWKSKELKETSRPGETEGEFRARLVHLAREKRDQAVEKLRRRYAPKLARIQDRIKRAEDKMNREKSQYQQQKMQTAISFGATVLGALFGRKLTSVGNVGRATTAARGLGRAAREKGDVTRAVGKIEALHRKLEELETEFQDETVNLGETIDAAAFILEPIDIRPRKSDISVGNVSLVWTPWTVDADGIATPAYSEA